MSVCVFLGGRLASDARIVSDALEHRLPGANQLTEQTT